LTISRWQAYSQLVSDTIGPVDVVIDLDRSSGDPLFAQIRAAVARGIAGGGLARGVRLPPVRVLADRLGVNRATVQRAYRELEEAGQVASRVGSGTVVVGGPAPDSDRRPPTRPFARGALELLRAAENRDMPRIEGAIDFAMLLPDVARFPQRRLRRAVDAALRRGDEVLQYGSPAGLEALRSGVAHHIAAHGLHVSADDVLIVNGVQQALDLLAKIMIEPGDRVAVESPTYANVLPLLGLYGARVVPVAMDDDGIAIDALTRALDGHAPKLLYTMPSHQNPTGRTMPRARRQAVLDVCAAHGTLVVEDGCEQDLHFGDDPIPALASLDVRGDAVHLGTFSKGLFPGLRLGWIVARGEVLRLLTLAKRYSDYHADMLSQAVLVEILESGDYERHLIELRKTYRERMRRTVQALERHMPSEVHFRPPDGGFKLWLELPHGVRASAVVEDALKRGVLVLDARPFHLEGSANGERALRISISRTDPDRLEEGIGILGDVLSEAIARRQQQPQRLASESPPFV